MSGDFTVRISIGTVGDYASNYNLREVLQDEYIDIYEKNYVSVENVSLIIHITRGVIDLCVGLKAENVRGFLEDLKEFDTENVDDRGYIFIGSDSREDISADCAMCGDRIGMTPCVQFANRTDSCNIWVEETSYLVCIHQSCISGFIERIESLIQDDEVFQELL